MAAHDTGTGGPAGRGTRAGEFLPYVPYAKRTVGDVDPQTMPQRFTVADLRKEIAGLRRLNNRLGWHPLRAEAIERLETHIAARARAEAGALGGGPPAGADDEAGPEQQLQRTGRCTYQTAYGDPAIGLQYCGQPADDDLYATDLEGLCTRHGRQAAGIDDPEINVGDRVRDTDPDTAPARLGTVTAADNSGYKVRWDGQDTAYEADYGDLVPVDDDTAAAVPGGSEGPARPDGTAAVAGGEITGLAGAVEFTAGMARQADQGVSEVELAVGGLHDGGVTGPALDALSKAGEALTQASAAFRAAHTALSGDLAVRDAYHAHHGAGTREFLTQN